MSDYVNFSSSDLQCPSISFVLASELSPTATILSGSSSISSLDSLFSEYDEDSIGPVLESWTYADKTSTPNQILSNARIQAFLLDAAESVKLNYSLEMEDNMFQDSDIFYGGRDLLDLASNIVPYAWQRKTPLLTTDNIIDKTNNYAKKEEEMREKYTMKYCTSCGFSQPVPAI